MKDSYILVKMIDIRYGFDYVSDIIEHLTVL